uniref:Thymosin beta 1 n=2 Tax=Oryzias TaxID=8089 RepID=A0A3P9M1R7_ORYLA
MSDANPVNQELETFNKQKLKKTNTQEKNHLPTQAGSTNKSHPVRKPHRLIYTSLLYVSTPANLIIWECLVQTHLIIDWES